MSLPEIGAVPLQIGAGSPNFVAPGVELVVRSVRRSAPPADEDNALLGARHGDIENTHLL